MANKSSVLIVDDERANIIALTHILNSEYTVYAATSGQDAIEATREYQPDVILLDILMPEMDGYEVLALLKNTPETKKIPVIFITGLTDVGAEQKGLALGAADYIPKPFHAPIVELRVRNQIRLLKHIDMINQRLKQQTLMASISQRFLSETDLGTLLTNTLREVGEFMGIAQILLFYLEEDGTTLICQHEWLKHSLELTPFIGSQIALNESILSFVHNLMSSGGDLCLHSNDPAFKTVMNPFRKRLHNYITIPIVVKGKLHAAIDFSKEDDGAEWDESEINLAIMVASTISGMFERDAMERQFSIVENSPQSIIHLTHDGAVSYVNPAAAAACGYTKTEILAGGLGLVLSEQTAQAFRETHIPNTLRNGSDHSDFSITCKDGKIKTMAFECFLTEENNIGVIAQDVTEKRALEAAILVAKDMAEQNSRAKNEFLSRISHEMHTPMNVIIGMTAVAKNSGDKNQIADCHKEIGNASRQLLQLIDDALDVSALEKSTLTLERSKFSFGEMVSNLLKTIQPFIDEKHQTLSWQVSPRIPSSLVGDVNRLSQVVRNLMMNANKFTPEHGTILLKAHMMGELVGTATLSIEIIDSGIGIPKEKHATIFHLFEQVDGSAARKFEGVGLGLVISKQIVELMGGKIWVESEPGKGAKFTFTFNVETCQDDSGVHVVSVHGEQPTNFTGKTVLLVEDVKINRTIVMSLLKDTGIRIDCAENGQQAFEMFTAALGKYDIILMDISMPVMDGWEATRRIRSLGGTAGEQVPIVAVTAQTHQEDVSKCFAVGMNDHIGKPINSGELLRKINQYLYPDSK